MILSASRRTDIPAFFSDWFFRRIKDGFFMVRNPMNAHQVSRVDITPDLVDCIVFWTKDPKPMLGRLGELSDYSYYFQYTLNGYGYDTEPKVPPLEERIDTFTELSRRIGRERVIWRYDPIFFSEKYSGAFHTECFEYLAKRLSDSTEKCVFSFVDIYPTKNQRNMKELRLRVPDAAETRRLAGKMADIGRRYGITLATCAEAADLSSFGIEHNSCIDQQLIERICGYSLNVKADGQRKNCGCVKCEEMGSYDTCPHGCVYCYANFRSEVTAQKLAAYDPESPMLCDSLLPDDQLSVRKVKLLKAKPADTVPENQDCEQLSLF